MKLDKVTQVIQTFAARVVTEAKQNAQKNSVSGNLANSISSKERINLSQSLISFFMSGYGKFQDLGVKGKNSGESVGKQFYGPSYPEYKYTDKAPPPNKLDKWVVRKGLAPRDKRGRFTGRSIDTVGFRKSITFLISRKIYFQGIKPTLFFTKPFQKYFTNLPQELANAYGDDFDTSIQVIFDNNK